MELRNSIERRLLGKSRAIKEIREQIQKIAPTNYPVLISGETGVGKTLAAELIHELSPRASKEFIHLNCSNISPELFESELFGHERGAFTGAVGRKKGKLELADGGTVFLDEIGDPHPHNQGKLLLFMDRGVFYRLGGIEKLKADVRIIAATNKDLLFEMKRGRFRQELYFRISTLEIYIPPLRERNEDIPIIVESILKRECDRLAVNKSFSPEALDKLVAYHWPGNIRELENVVKKALVICDDCRIKAGEITFRNIYCYSPSEHNGSENHSVLQKYKEMVEEGKSFWEVIHKPFLKRELKREEVVEIIRNGLREAGNYRKLMDFFNAGKTNKDYKIFMKIIHYHKLNR